MNSHRIASFDSFKIVPLYVVQNQQAWYQNEDTGVYFSFEMRAPDEGEEDDPAAAYPVSFNMNFFRPSFFALEAEPEFSRVVSDLDLVVLDPQNDGMGEGNFDPARFVSGWRKGNEFGYSAILRESAGKPTLCRCRQTNWNVFGGGTMSGASFNNSSGTPYLCLVLCSSKKTP